MICLDTNVLEFGFYPENKEHLLEERDRYKPKSSRDLLDSIMDNDIECIIPSIVMAEYASLAAKLYSIKKIDSNIDSIRKYAEISWLTESEFYSLKPTIEKIQYKGADSLIAATARHYDAALATYDLKLIGHLDNNKSAKVLGIRAGTPEKLMEEGMI